MKIILTNHLKFRLYDRTLDIEKIRLTVTRPALSVPGKGDSIKYQREFEGRILRVVGKHIVSKRTFIVLTAYYLKSRT